MKRNKEKKRFDYELELVDEEINRSERFDLNFCVLAVELSHLNPRGLSRILPGDVISFHIVNKYIRNYDRIFGPYFRRYFIILPQTDTRGADVVKQRIQEIALKYQWGNVSIGVAIFPDNGKKAVELLNTAVDKISNP
ncbi:MAG: GGDEF domain-containing protein [Candidatus Aminicenantes bacterium]